MNRRVSGVSVWGTISLCMVMAFACRAAFGHNDSVGSEASGNVVWQSQMPDGRLIFGQRPEVGAVRTIATTYQKLSQTEIERAKQNKHAMDEKIQALQRRQQMKRSREEQQTAQGDLYGVGPDETTDVVVLRKAVRSPSLSEMQVPSSGTIPADSHRFVPAGAGVKAPGFIGSGFSTKSQ